MEFVYLVQHSYEVGENGEFDEVKLIGVYSTQEKAEEVVERYKEIPGFKNYLNGFHIGEHEINKDNWNEGFISWLEANETLDE
jgi:hypothetical protein